MTEVRAPGPAFVSVLESRIRRELETQLDATLAARLSVQLRLYPDDGTGETTAPLGGRRPPSVGPLLPLIEDIRSRADHAPVYEAVKRCVDVAASAGLLLLISPLLLLIAAAIRVRSPGPVLFKQTRIGQEAKPFTMLKFRSMRVDVDHDIHQAYVTDFIKDGAPGTEGSDTGSAKVFKIANDPRVTRLGRLLRRASLDELPQLWNVLRGEMSLVGPRPPLAYELEHYKPWHLRRVLEVKPGVTGLWQVAGRSRTTFDEMVRLDLRYAQTRSLATDLRILLATPRVVVEGKGAY